MDPDSPLQTRLCRQCGDEYPVDHFRRKRRDGERRETVCRNCHKANMRAWRRARTEAALKSFVKRAPNQLLDRRLRAVANDTLRRLGGVEALSQMLASTAKALHAAKPTDPLPLRAAMAVVRLHQYIDARQNVNEAADCDDYSGLSTDEIKARIRQAIIDLIRKHPEIAVAAAEQLCWTVIPSSACKK